MITNFRHVDVPFNSYPLILRHQEVALIWAYNEEKSEWLNEFVWMFGESLIKASSNPTSPAEWSIDATFIRKCKTSMYWNEVIHEELHQRNLHDSCILLKFEAYSIHSRPWTCQIDVGLYPRFNNNDELLNYPKIFKYSPERLAILTTFSIIPSPMPPVHIYITHEAMQSTGTSEIKWWMETTSTNHGIAMMHMSNDEFLLIRVTSIKSDPIGNFGLFTVRIPRTFYSNSTEPYHRFDSLSLSELSLAYFLNTQNRNVHQQTFWRVSVLNNNELYDNIIRLIYECRKLTLDSIDRVLEAGTKLQQLEYALATVWISIMGNYTHIAEHSRVCVMGQLFSSRICTSCPLKSLRYPYGEVSIFDTTRVGICTLSIYQIHCIG